MMAFPVLFTEFIIASLSSGDRVLRSIKSQLIELFSITFMASCTPNP